MSNYLAIATVTAALSDLMQDVVVNAIPGISGDAVTTQPPAAIAAGGTTTARINIYLYQVTPNPHLGNNDLPTRRADGTLIERPQVALNLHYLLSFYGNETSLEPERLLGKAVSVLHAQPYLRRVQLRSAINKKKDLLKGSDLADQVELVKFTPLGLNLEEFSKLWSVFFQTTYTLSVAYAASVVLISGEEIPDSAGPVQTPKFSVNPAVPGVKPAQPNTLADLQLWLSSDRGISKDERGQVSRWLDQSDRKREVLFTVDAAFANELDQEGKPSAALRGKFQEGGKQLTAAATIKKEQPGSRWVLQDTDSSYVIQKENQKLSVYTQMHDALQATVGSRPNWVSSGLKRKPALRFEGFNYLAIDGLHYATADAISGITLFALVRSSSANPQILFSFDGDQYWSVAFNSATGGIGWHTHSQNPAASHSMITKETYHDGNWHLLCVWFSAGATEDKQIFVDGKKVEPVQEKLLVSVNGANVDLPAAVEGQTVAPLNAHAGNKLGGGAGRYGFIGVGSKADTSAGGIGPAEFLRGDLAEIVLYGRGLTTEERQQIERYFIEKYANP
jgi:hypothetical protein